MQNITQAEIDRFKRDGVVHLRDVFAPLWIELLDEGLQTAFHEPSPRFEAAAVHVQVQIFEVRQDVYGRTSGLAVAQAQTTEEIDDTQQIVRLWPTAIVSVAS